MSSKNKEHLGVKHLKSALADGKIDRRQFLRDSTLLGLSAAAAYAFVGKVTGEQIIPKARAATLPKGGTIRIGAAVQPLDKPHTYEWTQPDITININEYLTKTANDNITRGFLAESWEASEDLRTWTFNIRKGVNWKSGRPFTADDAIWNINHVLDPKTGSSGLGLFKGYMTNSVDTGEKDDKGKPKMTTELWDANAIEKVDDYTFRMNTKIPQLAVPEHLFGWPVQMLDPAEGGNFGVGSNGTGAWDVVEIQGREKVILKARGPHWSGTGPFADTLEFLDLEDSPDAKFGALASGQIDMVRTLDVTFAQRAKDHPDLVLSTCASGQTNVARMQMGVKPFDNPKVRKAMRLAIDTRKVAEIGFYGVGVPAEHHHVSPLHPEYAELPWHMQDIAGAKKLLSEAGYPNGIDIKIDMQNVPYQLTTVQVMKEMWAKAGIRVTINAMPPGQYWDVWKSTPFGLTSWSHRPLGVQVLALAYRTGVPWNESKYSNKEFDDLLNRAEGTFDIEERRNIVKRIETIMQEDGPIVQPFWRPSLVAHNKRVHGFSAHPSTRTFANEIGIDPA